MSKAGTTAEKPATESVAKDKKAAKGAPRPRKWDYGITPEAKIVITVEGEPNVKRDVLKDFEKLGKGNITCDAFFAAGGTRHGLRVMSRRKLIKVVHADGTEYPKEYVKPEKPAKAEKAAKPAKADKKQTQAERLGGGKTAK